MVETPKQQIESSVPGKPKTTLNGTECTSQFFLFI